MTKKEKGLLLRQSCRAESAGEQLASDNSFEKLFSSLEENLILKIEDTMSNVDAKLLEKKESDEPSSAKNKRQLAISSIEQYQVRQRSLSTVLGDISERAWLILLEIYAVQKNARYLTVSDIGRTFDFPQASSLRYISHLIDNGVLLREACFKDRRLQYVLLTEKGTALVEKTLADIEAVQF